MPGTPRRFRRPLIALVAVFAASFAASDASACSTMKAGPAACRTACGCCTREGHENTAARAEVATPVVPQAPAVGRTAPAEPCSCRSQEPAAPSPQPARGAAEGRIELGKGATSGPFGAAVAVRTPLVPQVPATQSPPKAPLYLRNVRLLF